MLTSNSVGGSQLSIWSGVWLAAHPRCWERSPSKEQSVLDAIVVEVADATHGYLDDEGWATPHSHQHHYGGGLKGRR